MYLELTTLSYLHTNKGGWNKKASLKNSKRQRALHQNWTWALKRGKLSRSASGWVFWTPLWASFMCSGTTQWRLFDFGVLKDKEPNHAPPKFIHLWQNIKKKEAGGAKTRPAPGGFLPPPPGAKAGGLIPPPTGQSFPPVQANKGEAQSLCKTCQSVVALFTQWSSFPPIFPRLCRSSPSFRFWGSCSCSPAQHWCVGGFHICRLQVSRRIWLCTSVFIVVFQTPNCPLLTSLSSSSKDAAKSGWVQFSWVVRPPAAHKFHTFHGKGHQVWKKLRGTGLKRWWLITAPSVKIPSTWTITPKLSGGTKTVNCKYIVLLFLHTLLCSGSISSIGRVWLCSSFPFLLQFWTIYLVTCLC